MKIDFNDENSCSAWDHDLIEAATKFNDKYPGINICDLFYEAVKWSEEHPRWISVEDELPAETWVLSKNVLITDGFHFGISFYNYDMEKWNNIHFVPTHWMYLPAYPVNY